MIFERSHQMLAPRFETGQNGGDDLGSSAIHRRFSPVPLMTEQKGALPSGHGLASHHAKSSFPAGAFALGASVSQLIGAPVF